MAMPALLTSTSTPSVRASTAWARLVPAPGLARFTGRNSGSPMQVGGDRIQPGGRGVREDHAGPRRIEGPCYRFADSAARTGHERRFRCKDGHVVFPLDCQGSRDESAPPSRYAKSASARSSMLSRGAASAAVSGSWKAVWAVNRARPSIAESTALEEQDLLALHAWEVEPPMLRVVREVEHLTDAVRALRARERSAVIALVHEVRRDKVLRADGPSVANRERKGLHRSLNGVPRIDEREPPLQQIGGLAGKQIAYPLASRPRGVVVVNRKYRDAGTGAPVARGPSNVVEDADSRSSGNVPYQALDLGIVNALDLFVVLEVGDRGRLDTKLESFAIEARPLHERSGIADLHVPDVHLDLSPGGSARVPRRDIGRRFDTRVDDVVQVCPHGLERATGFRMRPHQCDSARTDTTWRNADPMARQDAGQRFAASKSPSGAEGPNSWSLFGREPSASTASGYRVAALRVRGKGSASATGPRPAGNFRDRFIYGNEGQGCYRSGLLRPEERASGRSARSP